MTRDEIEKKYDSFYLSLLNHNCPYLVWQDIRFLLSELDKMEEKVKELEGSIKIHEDLELRLAEDKHKNWLDWKRAESELLKWKAPHEDIELQEMRDQSKQPSLAAKQAYINALECHLKQAESRIKKLEKDSDNLDMALNDSMTAEGQAEARLKRLQEAAGKVFNWYFIFGVDNDAAREHLANLGDVLKNKVQDEV